MAIANETRVSFCNQPKAHFGIGIDPVRVRGSSGPHNKLVVRVLYGLDPHNNVTTK